MESLKAAIAAWKRMSAEERDLFLLFIDPAHEGVTAKSSPPADTRGPDRRGRYACPVCQKVLPTRRGRGIHMTHLHPDVEPTSEAK